MNFFEFYDLPISFVVDEKVLKQRFLQKSKKHHHDIHNISSADEKEAVLKRSTINNQA